MHLCPALLIALQAVSAPDTAHIVIVATTDVHGRVFGWDYVRDAAAPGGLSRAATALETLRARYPGSVVLVDAGDLLQGNPFATYYGRYDKRQPRPVVEISCAAPPPRPRTATSRQTSMTRRGDRSSPERSSCPAAP